MAEGGKSRRGHRRSGDGGRFLQKFDWSLPARFQAGLFVRSELAAVADKARGFEGFEIAEDREVAADRAWDEAGDFFEDRPPAGMGDHGEGDGLGVEPGVGFEAVEAGVGGERLASGAYALDFGAGDEGAGGFEIEEVRGMPVGVRAAPMHVQAVAEAVPFESDDVGEEFARAEDSVGFQAGSGLGGFAKAAPRGFGRETGAAFTSAGQQGAVHRQAEAREGGPIEGLDAAVLRGFFDLLEELTLEGMRAVVFIAEDEGVCGESCGAGGGREGDEALAGAEGGFHFGAIGGGGQRRGRGVDGKRSRREPEGVGRLPKRRAALAMETGQGVHGVGGGGGIISMAEGCGKRAGNQRGRRAVDLMTSNGVSQGRLGRVVVQDFQGEEGGEPNAGRKGPGLIAGGCRGERMYGLIAISP